MTDTWTWATVTQASPLRIKVDGDTYALDATTDDLVGSLAVDDRVRVHLHADGIIVTGIQGGGNRSNPNLLINSNFMVNQRGAVSGASVAHNDYFLDRWENVSGIATTAISWADSGGVRTVTLGGTGVTRIIREVGEAQNFPAGTYTMSWPGSATGRAYGTSGSGPPFAASPYTFSVDGTETVNIDLSGEGDTIDGWVKVERGTVATPYQPPTYGDNLRACERYFQRLGGVDPYEPIAIGFGASTTRAQPLIFLPVPLRALPTVTWGGNFALRFSTNNKAVSAVALDRAGKSVIRLSVDSTEGLTADAPYELRTLNDLSAYIAFDAEL